MLRWRGLHECQLRASWLTKDHPASHRLLEFAPNLYPDFKRHGLGPLTKRFGVGLEHHHMTNYDAEATGTCSLSSSKMSLKSMGWPISGSEYRLIVWNSYKKARVRSMRLLYGSETRPALEHVSQAGLAVWDQVFRRSSTDSQDPCWTPTTEGLILGSACSEGEVFDAVMSQGLDAAGQGWLSTDDFIEVACHRLSAPLIAKEARSGHGRAPDHYQRSLIEVGSSPAEACSPLTR